MKSHIYFFITFLGAFAIGLLTYVYFNCFRASDLEITQPKLNITTTARTPAQNVDTATLEALHTKHGVTTSNPHNLTLLESIMKRDTHAVEIVNNPDGSRTARLNGTFRTVSTAKRLPDGTLTVGCFESFEALEKFISGAEIRESK